MKEKIQAASVLLALVLVSAALLAGANAAIQRIAAGLATEQQEMEELIAPFTAVTDGDSFAKIQENGLEYLKIFKDGKHVGYVIEAAGEGYGDDPIVILVGVDKGLTITGVTVTSHSETAALGGRAFTEESLAVFKGQGNAEVEFEAVSGATFSSSGLLSAVRKAMATLREALGPK